MTINWPVKALGDVCHVIGGGTPPKDKDHYFRGTIPWATVRDMRKDIIAETEFQITEEAVGASSTNIIPAHNVVIATRVGLGKVCFVERDTAINQDLRGIIPMRKNEISVHYLFWWLKSIAHLIVQEGTGATVQGVKLPFIKSLEIPLPPLPEQKRIVAILDEAFAGIAAATANAEKNLANARELFEGYLETIFADEEEGWTTKRLQDICEKITDGTHQTPTYFDNGIVFLSSRNVTSGKINWDNIKYIDQKQHLEMHKRLAPRMGDILLAKNGTTGVAAMVDRDIVFDIYVSLALLRPLKTIRPDLLLYFVNSPVAKRQFNKRLKGTGVPNLHLEEIREVLISFPISEAAQLALVAKLNDVSTNFRELEYNYQKKLLMLAELKQSILQKAFSGDLTTLPEAALQEEAA